MIRPRRGRAAFAAVFAIAAASSASTLASAVALSGAQERTFRPLRPLGPASRLTASVHLGDVDGDGALDVVVANGRHWPEQNRVFLNDGCGGFTLARRLGDEEDGTYAAPLADFDGDGDLDIVTNEFNDRPMVLVSDLSERREISCLQVSLRGRSSNRDGLGARVEVTAGGSRYTKVNDGQSGYLSQSSLPLYFGLGGADRVDLVEVTWPGGRKQSLAGVDCNQTIVIEESQ